jgi:hypothetical protein
MNFLDQLTFIPAQYLYAALGIFLFLLLFIASQIFKVEEGIFPQLLTKLDLLFKWVIKKLGEMNHFLFGRVVEAVDEFMVNQIFVNKTGKWVMGIWGSLVIFSLMTSYSATREWMEWIGVSHGISWALPLIVDLVIVGAIVQTAFYAFAGEEDFSTKVVVLGYTSISVFINVAHLVYGHELTFSILVGGVVAPIGIYLCSHYIYKTIRKMTYRDGMINTDIELRDAVNEKKMELGQLQMKIDAHKGIIAGIDDEVQAYYADQKERQEDIAYLEEKIALLDAEFIDKVPKSEGRLEQVRLLTEEGHSPEDIAKILNVQLRSARAYVRSANGAV